MGKQKITLLDVAAKAGVSRATASAVMGGRADAMHISQATRKRVRAAARRLGYRANLNARRLRSGRSRVIGVLAAHLGDIWYGMLVNELDACLHRAGFSMLLATAESRPGRGRGCLDNLLANSVEGIVFVGSALPVPDLLGDGAGIPSVWIGGDPGFSGSVAVGIDEAHAGEQLATHLAGLGHRTFGYVGFGKRQTDSPRRLAACRQALRAQGLSLPREHVALARSVAGLASAQGGREAGGRLLRKAPEVTAVVAFDDNTAFGVMQAAVELGRVVGKDLSVVGLDDNPYAALVTPSLTTVRFPMRAVVQSAVDVMVGMCGCPGSAPPGPKLVPGELVIRESTGPAPSGARTKRR